MTPKSKVSDHKVRTQKISALIMGAIIAVVIILQIIHDGIGNLLMVLPIGMK